MGVQNVHGFWQVSLRTKLNLRPHGSYLVDDTQSSGRGNGPTDGLGQPPQVFMKEGILGGTTVHDRVGIVKNGDTRLEHALRNSSEEAEGRSEEN